MAEECREQICAAGVSADCGYSILQGNSRDESDALLEDHPHLHTPGSSIDVFKALLVPGM